MSDPQVPKKQLPQNQGPKNEVPKNEGPSKHVMMKRAMLRVRDALDRDHAEELDIARLARIVSLSPDHLIRSFAAVFGETPHRYLQRRRVERAMFLLRTTTLPVTEICAQVGYSSLGAFSELFTAVVGRSPSQYRTAVETHPPSGVHGTFVRAWTRPSSHTHPSNSSISRKRESPSDD